MRFFLILAVTLLVFLNGATDACNAIASAVSARSLTLRGGAILAAVCNLAGGLLASVLFVGVGKAVAGAVDFGAFPAAGALACLGGAVLFTALMWCLRLPTSESHALLSSAAGVTVALGEKASAAILPAVLWMTVCTLGGFLSGVLLPRLIPRRLPPRWTARLQIVTAAGASFFHGVQDLPKFLAILAAAAQTELSGGFGVWVLAALVLGLGTLLGGRRMTEAVGSDLAKLTPTAALSSDLAAAFTLSVLSTLGIPSSTTHAKTAAVVGAAVSGRECALHRRQAGRLALGWILTFPLCALIGFLLARLFTVWL